MKLFGRIQITKILNPIQQHALGMQKNGLADGWVASRGG